MLNVETPIVIADSNTKPQTHKDTNFSIRGLGDALYTDVVDAQRIDLSFLEAQYNNKSLGDTLPDSLFQPVHKRAERLERSIRNTEKGRAQHEKDQIIRLLEGLQGHDWLRVMGVNGITETKKKQFEPARQHFIHACQAIINKFRNWSLEERRRKLEKARLLAEKSGQSKVKKGKGKKKSKAKEEEEHEAEAAEDEQDSRIEAGETQEDEEAEDEDVEGDSIGSDESSTGDTSEASSPAKQLREEARARSKLTAKQPHRAPRQQLPPPPSPPPREFKSFFSKRGERDSALNRTRRSGRKVLAFGIPIPDFPDQDFDLPEEYRDEETLKARARKKRRDKRGSKHG